MATELKATDGIHIYGWMRTELNLKGNDLLAYAVVYAFSQSGAGIYRGGINYLATWMGCSRNTAIASLKTLVGEELITEHPFEVNNVKFCNYTANLSQIEGVVQKLDGGSAKIAHINRSNNRSTNVVSISKDISTTYSKERTPKFVKPTIEEIATYIDEQGYKLDAAHFYDYYESNGWKVGKNPMKDWRAAVRTWAKRESETASPKQPQQPKESLAARNARAMANIMSHFSPEAQEYTKQFMYGNGTHDNE